MKPGVTRTILKLSNSTTFDYLEEKQSDDLRKINCQLSEIQNQLQELFASSSGVLGEGMIRHLQSKVQMLYNSLLDGLAEETNIDEKRAELRHLQQRLIVIHLECEIAQLNDTVSDKAVKGQDISEDRAKLNDLQSQLSEIEGDI